jgi:hypothetical protein
MAGSGWNVSPSVGDYVRMSQLLLEKAKMGFGLSQVAAVLAERPMARNVAELSVSAAGRGELAAGSASVSNPSLPPWPRRLSPPRPAAALLQVATRRMHAWRAAMVR